MASADSVTTTGHVAADSDTTPVSPERDADATSRAARMLSLLDRHARLLAAAITLLAVLLVCASYSRVGITGDEPAHVAAGLELIQRNRYTYDPVAPPLPRIASAALPYFSGLRSQGREGMYWEGYAVLQSTGSFRANVTKARIGTLVFLVLACAVTFLIGERVVGRRWALAALLLFASTPPLLAHAGLATTDVANTAMVAAAILAAIFYLERPGTARAAWLGVFTGLALASKLTALPFLVVAFGAICIVRALWVRRLGWPRLRVADLLIAPALAFLVLWASYRFSMRPVTTAAQRPHASVARLAPNPGALQTTLNRLIELPLPVPEYLDGFRFTVQWNKNGMPSFLLGERRMTGWWYFFPVAIAVKTPLPLLLFALVGAVVALALRRRPEDDWVTVAVAVVPVAIVGSVLPSSINIGLRHVLPIYPFVAVIAALGLRWASGRLRARDGRAGAVAAAGLVAVTLVAQTAIEANAFPHNLCYFNPVAGREPERVLVYSDCGWNQDYQPLGDTLKARGITRVTLGSNLPIPVEVLRGMGFTAEVLPLRPRTPTTGWVALDVFHWTMGSLFDPSIRPQDYAWIEGYPFVRVGKTVRLYHVPDSAGGTATNPVTSAPR